MGAMTSVANPMACDLCGRDVFAWLKDCPHCGSDVGYPNVRAAELPAEVEALQQRYMKAVHDLRHRNAQLNGLEFRDNIERESRAVVNRTHAALMQAISSKADAFAPFYRLVDAGIRNPAATLLDEMRERADPIIFPHYHREIRFAALSLDERGLRNYGLCTVSLRQQLISHRASLFDQNTLMWMLERDPKFSEGDLGASGLRAPWQARGMLAVAKKGPLIDSELQPCSFPSLLMSSGESSRRDDFIEVHIWGMMTVECIESVHFEDGDRNDVERSIEAALRQMLDQLHIPVTGVAA